MELQHPAYAERYQRTKRRLGKQRGAKVAQIDIARHLRGTERGMSQENVELIHRGHDTFNRRDLDAFLALHDPAVEFLPYEVSVQGGDPYRGHEGVRALYADLDDAFGDWRWTIRSVVDLGDRLAVQADFVGYGRSSGAETTLKNGGTAVRLSHKGRIVWQEWFVEKDGWTKALEAAGLSE